MEISPIKKYFDGFTLTTSSVLAVASAGADRIIDPIHTYAPWLANIFCDVGIAEGLNQIQTSFAGNFDPATANLMLEALPDAAFVSATMAFFGLALQDVEISENMNRIRYEVLQILPLFLISFNELDQLAISGNHTDFSQDMGLSLIAFLGFKLIDNFLIKKC